MYSCITCKRRKVKCDKRPGVCQRCEKLNIECVSSVDTSPPLPVDEVLTQAGYKRLRTSAACDRCREKKLKCDAVKPSCSTCLAKQVACCYAACRRRRGGSGVPSRTAAASRPRSRNTPIASRPHPSAAAECRPNAPVSPFSSDAPTRDPVPSSGPSPTLAPEPAARTGADLPSDADLLPYLDAFLSNVHPISCNNFLHPGCLYEKLEQAPPLLLLSICASSAKFLPEPGALELQRGDRWAREARELITSSLDCESTLTVCALQFLTQHHIHLAQFKAGSNLAAAAIRIARNLQLSQPARDRQGTFLEQECRRRLMWTVFVSDLLFHPVNGYIRAESLEEMPLPCNTWSFTQGIPCRTTTMRELRQQNHTLPALQATNNCAFLITILCIRRKIFEYIAAWYRSGDAPWLHGSTYFALCQELQTWKRTLPPNYIFTARSMYMFRVSRHLDMFFMIHAFYHQCFVLLNSAFAQAASFEAAFQTHSGPPLPLPSPPPPLAFLEACSKGALDHAIRLAALIDKTLSLDARHTFRDPWLTTCVWDATLAILSHPASPETEDIKARCMRFILKSLESSAQNLPIARATLGYIISAMLYSGIHTEHDTSIASEIVEFQPEWLTGRNTETYPGQYPFLVEQQKQQQKQQQQSELAIWDTLFRATEAAAAVPSATAEAAATTRQSSPNRALDAAPSMPMHMDMDIDLAVDGLLPFDFRPPFSDNNHVLSPAGQGQHQPLVDWGLDAVDWWWLPQ